MRSLSPKKDDAFKYLKNMSILNQFDLEIYKIFVSDAFNDLFLYKILEFFKFNGPIYFFHDVFIIQASMKAVLTSLRIS